jgi:urease accessory protein
MLPLLRLLQFASPALPVGAYSYSQGLEHAVEAALVQDEASAARWIEGVLRFSVANCEAPCLLAMMDAASTCERERLSLLNAWFLASRECAELRAETVQLGHSLVRLLEQLDGKAAPLTGFLRTLPEPSYPCAWACAACAFGLPRNHALAAYLWAWLENQVLAAVKLVPLGQSAGQRILFRLGEAVEELVARDACEPGEWTNFAPGLALAAVMHETQYTRLFRS